MASGDRMSGRKSLQWLFGQGCSIECGLSWTVPQEWRELERQEAINRIKRELLQLMEGPDVDSFPYGCLLTELEKSERTGWRHKFHTTNWDFLLEREIDARIPEVCPKWLADDWVSHLNGSVQPIADESQRSTFLLEWDNSGTWIPAVESNLAFGQLAWSQAFVVVGM